MLYSLSFTTAFAVLNKEELTLPTFHLATEELCFAFGRIHFNPTIPSAMQCKYICKPFYTTVEIHEPCNGLLCFNVKKYILPKPNPTKLAREDSVQFNVLTEHALLCYIQFNPILCSWHVHNQISFQDKKSIFDYVEDCKKKDFSSTFSSFNFDVGFDLIWTWLKQGQERWISIWVVKSESQPYSLNHNAREEYLV